MWTRVLINTGLQVTDTALTNESASSEAIQSIAFDAYRTTKPNADEKRKQLDSVGQYYDEKLAVQAESIRQLKCLLQLEDGDTFCIQHGQALDRMQRAISELAIELQGLCRDAKFQEDPQCL
jgi:hypothetical protein